MIEFLKRLFGGKPDRERLPTLDTIPRATMPSNVSLPPPSREELEEGIYDDVRRNIAAGYDDRGGVIQNAVWMFEDDMDAAEVNRIATLAYAEVAAKHLEAQKDWPEQTDNDRLDAAFNALEEKGVIARQNFSCCGTCGSGEIWDEVEEARGAGKPAHGYAFFHMQDTESAVDGGGLYLNYGSEIEGEKASLEVAGTIVEELHAHGLKTDWDGTIGMRIGVALDWKRRLPAAHATTR